MKKYMINSAALRMTFILIGMFISLGIWLTGIDVVHWLLFLPAAFLVFAGVTGICPSLIINKMIFKES
ncbi:MAG: hypothetical protein GQ550_04940 [Gammaproteobacteria bacterium]|nr:hypothetical protein [Gammaproteobacteria bacterium]